MKKYFKYPFYQSLRLRFGLIFGLLFLCSLLVIFVFLYSRLKKNFENNFDKQLVGQADAILQKSDISPLTIPVPEQGTFFLLTYNNKIKTDTLFNNLPFKAISFSGYSGSFGEWRATYKSRTLETGGVIRVVYALSGKNLSDELYRIRLILFIFIPAAIIVSVVAGYFLSGFLLRPINSIIAKTNQVQLHENIELLKEPTAKDELHELTVTINRMLERIKKQSSQQNAFFASASHELRTPLSVMMTELQVLLSGELPKETKSVLQNQLTEVRRINKLVNDFLLMSQLKSGTIALKKEKIDLAEIIMENIERLKEKSSQKQQSFKIDLYPTDTEFFVLADREQLSVIALNLLENAIKYGLPASIITIHINKREEEIVFRITNKTDIFIANAEELKNEFRQQGFHKEGFGLGLWIVDQLAKMNNASLGLFFEGLDFTAEIKFQTAGL